ncbi:MAG TPA: VOC family protein [Candidatus Dormibacteraeota bacterium]|nr:VOC family protein [Candidatus Dormibacteraeota bacterium]
MIKTIGHVALQVPDLDDSVRWATGVMGLREVKRDGRTSYLTHGPAHHSLIYIEGAEGALDHISLEAHDESALDELNDALAKRQVPTIAHEREPGVAQSIRFELPDGHVVEVFSGMEENEPRHTGRGVQPRKFGHPMLKSERPRETQRFLEEILGFRLSDDVGDGTLLFLRCNADHHGIGITKGGEGLHHYAWEVENIGQLGLLGDVLEKNDGKFLWGPGRHGAGGNLFTYHLDPAGCVVEYYADLIKIYDEASYRPGRWEMSDYRFANLWGPGIPGHEFFDAGAKLAPRKSAAARK